MREIGRLESMAEKSALMSVRGITMCRRITREAVEINMLSYYIV